MAPIALAIVLAGCTETERVEGGETHTAVAPTIQPAAAAIRPTGVIPRGATCANSACHTSMATARFTHGIVRSADGCSLCHEDDAGGHVYPLKRPGNAGCTTCHDDVIGNRSHQHGASEVSCLACHDPHASEHTALRKTESIAETCATCHPPENHAVLHGPFATGACVACHDPHESDHPALLREAGAEHCYVCHEEMRVAMQSATRLHAPAGMDCLICHSAHGSDHPHALRQPIAEGCFTCHTDLEQMIDGAAAPHGALSLRDQCANCHDAHASDRPSLLKAPQDVLCLQCHDREITATDGRTIPDMSASIHDRKFLHGPVETGHCTVCHNVHGASQSRLLRTGFTDSFYASFDLKHYALCFECHEQELVTTERTTTLTDFRDGDLNLHYLHVNRQEKGRTCRACHEIHGSDLPAHVAESVPFGASQWALPIAFRQTTTGGSCAPGCHKKMTYDRVVPQPPSGDDR